ncbi:MAG: hypothetical protein ACLFVJ_09970 [Persicimonas sp.]
MSDQENEMSEDELNSLLADLESRADAGEGAAAGADGDDEDLEAFLSRLESEEASTSSGKKAAGGQKKVASAERDDELDARFAELDNLQPDDLPATTPDKKAKKKAGKKAAKAEKKKDKQEAKGEEAGEEGRSRGARFAVAALKVVAVALPIAAFAWVLGSFLANWVSAGWLIAIMSLIFALGMPLLVSRYVKKGKFAWWAAGVGVLLTVALTAPMPETAGETLDDYGHWPATTVGELAGWEADNALVQINASVAGALGGLLYTPPAGEADGPLELGTEHSLYGQEQAETPNTAPTPEDAGADEGVTGTPR